MCGAQGDTRGLVRFECFLPSGCAQTPTVPRLETRKAKFGQRCRKIVAARFGEFEKCGSHDGADGMATNVLRSRIAAAVSIESGHWTPRTDFKRLAKHVAGRTPWFSVSPVVPQHLIPQRFHSEAFLNDQQSDDDIPHATQYAAKIGIAVHSFN